MMTTRSAILLASTALLLPAAAQFRIPEVDSARFSSSYTGGLDIDGAPGELDIFKLGFYSRLAREDIKPIPELSIVPLVGYGFTSLDFRDTAAAFPIEDEGLHTVSLSSFFVYGQQDSRWLYGAWASAELASDFQHIDGDDFTFDLAAGAAYRFTDRFLFGFGAGAFNLNGDVTVLPAIGFDWAVNDFFRLGLYGPLFVAQYNVNENWILSLRASYQGDEWNITDAAGRSRTLDLSTFRVGLHAERQLTDNLSLRFGGGLALANDIELKSPGGSRVFKRDLDEGFYGEVLLNVKKW